jgi:hypothetical protein
LQHRTFVDAAAAAGVADGSMVIGSVRDRPYPAVYALNR